MLDLRLSFSHLPISGRPSSPLDPFRLWLYMRKLPPGSVVFSPGYNAPLFVNRTYIFTIHDLNHLDRPENTSFLKRLYYRLIIRKAARHAFRVLTVSEFSRQRIIEWTGCKRDQVINVGNGVDPSYNPEVMPYSPGYTYLLCISNRKPHKNEGRLIEAFAKAEIQQEIRLLFTGEADSAVRKTCRRHNVEARVKFLGNVTEEDMPSLFRGALALVFPSLYEGFGLPVIEAMACGAPVLTSNTTALMEIAEDAALLVDPLSVQEIRNGIERLCHDETFRKDLTRKGLERAALFSWKKVVAKIESALNERQATIGGK